MECLNLSRVIGFQQYITEECGMSMEHMHNYSDKNELHELVESFSRFLSDTIETGCDVGEITHQDSASFWEMYNARTDDARRYVENITYARKQFIDSSIGSGG